MMKQKIKTQLFDGDIGAFPKSLPDTLKFLRGLLKDVPKEFHKNTEIVFRIYDEFDDDYRKQIFEVSWWRLETTEEHDQRQHNTIVADIAFKEQQLRRERETFLKLKQKFEGEQL